MTKRAQRIIRVVAYSCLTLLLGACASAFMKGGALVGAGYQPLEVIVTYKAEGTVPPNVVYQLVDTERGEALFEKSLDGSGTLFLLRWEDKDGDHFGGWVARSHGYEFVIPKDRRQNAKKFFYPVGTYRYEKLAEGGRIVSNYPASPVATLIPQ
jgi:hypothetical protein